MEPNATFKVEVRESDYLSSYTVFIFRECDGGNDVAYPVEGGWELKRIKNGEPVGNVPFLKLNYKVARELFNALGKHFQPNKIATEEQLKATQYHLEDMRALVFKR